MERVVCGRENWARLGQILKGLVYSYPVGRGSHSGFESAAGSSTATPIFSRPLGAVGGRDWR